MDSDMDYMSSCHGLLHYFNFLASIMDVVDGISIHKPHWRLIDIKKSSRHRLFRHSMKDVDDLNCVLCGKLEGDEHLFWACALKKTI
ncbi:hypothetical protein PHYBLDRAFT_151220 [Phycomyces blakesleeanus NRRL 1555(-)]|uniref:Uncharacterized protein n=1 Tax=Phycomyces blakesleeanus (strain ATCC 8743b / DSM 1359 / FGSC 10004 / NBRC 33097 / NRRL 1555) TaxID=763407 RepID=A0A167KBM4_PHYB8|nr:hypothetical protein PHYBLDRAFT_151220 [Phycomyces blakesleeanus NRRL 1555(-)]OAD67697.1 hypothetical protein PHYBLDRAFT_151220 [Phycomyces blakesleeanus NRRL 1555(-)]|eukprot:XP_018285737.1 hypothetical protein PHYBLDRAFT_151220 [Phycomyces blakesleeanus NRRL 1555(-)]